MKLTIASVELDRLKTLTRDVVLGIITQEGEVRLSVSDAQKRPGHVEWLAGEMITNVIRGFSLLVSDGLVEAVFPRSRLNPGSDARIEEALLQQLLMILPAAPSIKVLE